MQIRWEWALPSSFIRWVLQYQCFAIDWIIKCMFNDLSAYLYPMKDSLVILVNINQSILYFHWPLKCNKSAFSELKNCPERVYWSSLFTRRLPCRVQLPPFDYKRYSSRASLTSTRRRRSSTPKTIFWGNLKYELQRANWPYISTVVCLMSMAVPHGWIGGWRRRRIHYLRVR